ncbi:MULTISPECIES: putative bifunctional diguanylate cyclase/phosphodiesterase [unclassified Erwinia]|uniref:putative bifunctional diguanylate cyclase/phosphodiesterase n=1 Tax=unclassified Erwinia TaxID=2622719 RepID=UPI0013040B90|nr:MULTISPECIES: EAL domain-containing protein [unclassified Erwinia]
MAESGSLRRDFQRNVLFPVIAVLLLVMVGAALVLTQIATIADKKALEKQQQVVKNLLLLDLTHWRQHHESLQQWDDLRNHLGPAATDRQWRQQHLGEALWRLQDADEVWLLDSHNQLVEGWRKGQPATAADWAQTAPTLHPWLSHFQQNPAIVFSDIVRLHDRVAELSLGDIHATRDFPASRLLRIRYLPDNFFAALETGGVLQNFHFNHPAKKATGAGFQLNSALNTPVSYLSWLPMRPGKEIQQVMLPFVCVVLAIVVLLSLLMMRRLARASHSLARSLHQLRESEAHAQHLASHDVLSGLPNRIMIHTRLSELLAAMPPRGSGLALLLLDLDRFKMINDTWGHPIGDALIVAVAQRLTSLLLPEAAVVGRLGGDEFVVLLNDITERAEAEAFCHQVIDDLATTLLIQGYQLHTGVSIGVVLAPKHGLNRRELMRKADIALYAAKSRGRGQFCLYEGSMDSSVKLRQLLANELRDALEDDTELMLWYQPIICALSGKIVGVEALIRWQHPQQGMISPATFIPLAEENGLIIPLGEWTLRQAFSMAKRWPQLMVAVNVSPLQLRSRHFVDRLMQLVAAAGIAPQQIELEITEGILIDDEQEANALVRSLRERGFHLALDDFGTGYSSLSYLSRFPVNTIKIDRAFIQPLGQVANATAIVRAVVDLGHAMQLSVTAEGVETQEQYAALTAAGCDRLQGYLFHRAQPAEAIHDLLIAQSAPGQNARPQ